MFGPPVIADNLAARISAILLGSFVVLAIALGAVMMWPRPGDTSAGLFQLPVPRETAAIVEALEASPPTSRPLVVRALNTSIVSVRLAPDFPPVPPGLTRSAKLEGLFKSYSDILHDRPFRVDIRRGLLSSLIVPRKAGAPGPSVRMSIQLRDGAVLVIERRPPAFVRGYIVRAAAAAAVIGLILLGALTLAVRQTARPVNRLALAVRDFALDSHTPALPERGPRELRQLAAAFNEMRRRIRGLVEDRTRVLGAIAHDLRTYLTRLRLRVDFIGDADQRLRAERDIEEMSRLLDDILLFAENATRPNSNLGILDLAAETRDFLAVRTEMGEAVSLRAPLPTDRLTVQCTPLAYRRMLSNLVDNALRYGGAARVSLALNGDRVEVSVEDDGPGVPEEALNLITRPFERLESSRARSTGGAGLGLAIVKGLAESVSGGLTLANRPSGGLSATLAFKSAVATESPWST